MIPMEYWNHSASKLLLSFCWYCLKFRCTEDKQQYAMVDQKQVNIDKIITNAKQRNLCRTIPANHWNHFASKLLLSFCSSSWQRNTEIILQAKRWNYRTCFGPWGAKRGSQIRCWSINAKVTCYRLFYEKVNGFF